METGIFDAPGSTVTMARFLKAEIDIGPFQKAEMDQYQIALHKTATDRRTKTEIAYGPEKKDVMRSLSPQTEISDDEKEQIESFTVRLRLWMSRISAIIKIVAGRKEPGAIETPCITDCLHLSRTTKIIRSPNSNLCH